MQATEKRSDTAFLGRLLMFLAIYSFACESEEPSPSLIPQTSQIRYFVANAGGDQGVLTGELVELEAVFAQNQSNNEFTWRFLLKPENSEAVLSNPNLPGTSFIADKQGIYKLELAMSQGRFAVLDSITVSAFTVVNQQGSYQNEYGASGEVNNLVVYQNKLYAAGKFLQIGGVLANGFASFDGTTWDRAGLNEGRISDMIVYQDELYITGIFGHLGGKPIQNIARWDGERWSSLAGNLNQSNTYATMEVFEGALYIGGALNGSRLLKWDGQQVTEIPIPQGNYVSELFTFQNSLYIRASNEVCQPVVGFEGWWDCDFKPFYFRFDGTEMLEVTPDQGEDWKRIAPGHFQYEDFFPFIGNRDGGFMTGYQDKLYFNCGYWKDQIFQEFTYPFEKVFVLKTLENRLYVGGINQTAGNQNNGFINWDGEQWTTLGLGVNGRVIAIEQFQGQIYIGGQFDQAGGQPAQNLVAFKGL